MLITRIRNIIRQIKLLFTTTSRTNKFIPKHRFFFIHIPKTAGTSFRVAVNQQLQSKVYNDYGATSHNSSDEVRHVVYQNEDFFALTQLFHQNPDVWITGHVTLKKYLHMVPVTHTVCFVRDPVKREISHYMHRVKHHDESRDFKTYLNNQANNAQSKCLAYLPLGLIGFVGITEEYNEAIKLFNDTYSLNLKSLHKNSNQDSLDKQKTVSHELIDLIGSVNKKDCMYYESAKTLFLERLRIAKLNQPWTYGHVTINSSGMMTGCAYQNNDYAVDLEIVINQEVIGRVTANEFFDKYPRANFPRGRFIGFKFKIGEGIKPKTQIDIMVAKTGQTLNIEPLMVN